MTMTKQMQEAIKQDKEAQAYFKNVKCCGVVRTTALWANAIDWSKAKELKVHEAHHQGLFEWYARRTDHGD